MNRAVLAKAGQDDEGRENLQQIASNRQQGKDAGRWVQLKKEIERSSIETIGPEASGEFPWTNETEYNQSKYEQVWYQIEQVMNGLEVEQTSTVGDEPE